MPVDKALRLLQKIQAYKKMRDTPPAHAGVTTDEILHHAVEVREKAMMDLFGKPWEQFSSADDQEGDMLDLLETMLLRLHW